MSNEPNCDISFHVPFVHRLRSTLDCFGNDWNIILPLFETDEQPTRIQFWIDAGVADASPQLLRDIETKFDSDKFRRLARIEVLPGGEDIKEDFGFVDTILSAMHEDGLDRRSYCCVVGGGAVLDVVGFAAATAHRGIRLIRFPSTTLAQADSGVGVKNAVNRFNNKNWLGTFAVPWAVVNDQKLLERLPDRDFRSGFSEAVKVSLLKSSEDFAFLQSNATAIAERSMAIASEAILRSVSLHLKHITGGGDPFESRQARPLDYGHWSAHKLEILSRFHLRHGEAVSIGVALDTVYSHLEHNLSESVVDKTIEVLTDLGLPIYHPLLEDSRLVDGLEEFRQHLGGQLTLTMLRDIGNPIEVHQTNPHSIRKAIEMLKSLAENYSLPSTGLLH